MRFSKRFEEDCAWYLKFKDKFTFAGSIFNQALIEYSETGKSAKECFYIRDSTGRIEPTSEPELLKQIYICKASINLHINMWAAAIAENTLFTSELQDFELLLWMKDALYKQFLKSNPNTYLYPKNFTEVINFSDRVSKDKLALVAIPEASYTD
jgi:hypothetical protein